MRKIVLASASPRRKALLQQIGLNFVIDKRVREDIIPSAIDPHASAREISLKKAESVAAFHPDALIIAADTFGIIDGKVIGKPNSVNDATKMLKAISGWSHSVITGFTVLDTLTQKSVSRSVETKVYIKKLSEQEITGYVKSGEPLDKAGAYAIQGLGAVLVERIEGDYFNVMGLPLNALAEALK
ncbi:MAG TPA: Maf family protein, partial [Dehalococcoidales bacterium]|nr:Maf family protein [Dehalococcoidales bacterium]